MKVFPANVGNGFRDKILDLISYHVLTSKRRYYFIKEGNESQFCDCNLFLDNKLSLWQECNLFHVKHSNKYYDIYQSQGINYIVFGASPIYYTVKCIRYSNLVNRPSGDMLLICESMTYNNSAWYMNYAYADLNLLLK